MPIGSSDRINIGVLAERAPGVDSSSRAVPATKPASTTTPTWKPVLESEIRGKFSKTVMLSSR
jgi:hypothetical protein